MNSLEGKKVLITGGLGFIGSNLAERLVDLNCEVTLVDSLIPEYGGNLWNIEPFKDNVDVNISDVRDEQPAYQERLRGNENLEYTEKLYSKILSLPLYPEMSDFQVERVTSALSEWVVNKKGKQLV